jgi:hypothetical protein
LSGQPGQKEGEKRLMPQRQAISRRDKATSKERTLWIDMLICMAAIRTKTALILPDNGSQTVSMVFWGAHPKKKSDRISEIDEYENSVPTSETRIDIATIRLLLNQIVPRSTL